jgi:hypothetical protein
MKMTVGEILAMVDSIRPNNVDRELKIQYLNEVEAEVFDLYLGFKCGKEVEIKPIHGRAFLHGETDTLEGYTNAEGEAKAEPEGRLTIMGTSPYRIVEPLGKMKESEPMMLLPSLKSYTQGDEDAVVLLDSRFMGIYTNYIKAKIDYAEDEIESYTNAVQAYNAEKEAWLSYLNRYLVHGQRKARGLI